MKNETTKKFAEFYRRHRQRKRWQKGVTCLAAVVVFCITYALILPAITLDSNVYCGETEHTHSEHCYEKKMICTLETGENHIHMENCYETVTTLVCKPEETERHEHTESCYDENAQLLCELGEYEEHTHTEECYGTESVLMCEETEEHTHTESCYEYELACGLKEHTHTLACASNPDADVENAADWENTMGDVELTGVWADDFVAVAESQLGYQESTKNYQVSEDEQNVRGYTRYGEWYGQPYGDWCTMFVSFCLNYARISEAEIPREDNCQQWIEKLSGQHEGYEDYDLYTEAADYIPVSGNLVFFDYNEDDISDHVGIVVDYSESALPGEMELKTIEGDSGGEVRYVSYESEDKRIMGYARLPENPELALMALDDGDYGTVDSFYLWLKLRDLNNQIRDIYSNPKWENGSFNGTGISDVRMYTAENGKNNYLIPVNYFVTNYKDYGYTFNAADTAVCPFVYAPDANNPAGNLTAASYVYMADMAKADEQNSGWYVQVQDTTGEAIPRSNIYYTFFETKEVTAFRFWQHAKKSGESSYTKVAGYDSNDNTTDLMDLTDVLQVLGVDGNTTNYYLIPVRYFVNNYKDYGYTFNSADIENCPIQYAPNAYNPADNLTVAAYIYVADMANAGEEQSGWYVQVKDTTGLSLPRSNVYYRASAKVVKDTVSPSGTVINLFDYWINDVMEDDISQKWYDGEYNKGINNGHALKFTPYGPGEQGSNANKYTGDASIYEGIVANTLTNGYPTLSGKQIFGYTDEDSVSSTESLDYLFDPKYDGDSIAYRHAYRNVSGLMQTNKEGYYYYDCTKNYAEYIEETNSFNIYDTPAVGTGQFFPFNTYSAASNISSADDSSLNHYFGMTLTARFIQQYGGCTNAIGQTQTPMVFDFSGDDDVWIFIDDVLVADLGGIHSAAKVDINFNTGIVTVNDVQQTTIKQAFIDAKKATAEDTDGWQGDTFADDTYHTLKFYYLERGSSASNLKLTYNLSTYPATSIYKVNQYDEKVAGARFAVYAANQNYEILSKKDGQIIELPENYTYDDMGNIVSTDVFDGDDTQINGSILVNALYTGITDRNGEMIFVDDDGMPYTLAELQSMFGNYFVLKEIEVPKGYRLVNDTINLRIYDNRVLLCGNTYDSGVYASASLQVTAPNILKKAGTDTDTIQYVEDSGTLGTLFAVVLKYTGSGEAELSEQDKWIPVYGTSEAGFGLTDVADYGSYIEAVIATAKTNMNEYGTNAVFAMAGDGQMQVVLDELPGDITTYYYMLGDNKAETQYTVAYYWTSKTLAEATYENTVRVDAAASGYGFSRSFGATIAVPNLLNRLVTQKLDADGGLVNGAAFALYRVAQDDSGIDPLIYYVADDKTEIHLDALDVSTGTGTAALKSGEGGEYSLASNGVITVTVGNTVYTITPVDRDVTRSADDEANLIGEDGTASFSNMADGYYYLREIAAPVGYELNTTEVMVLVDDTAVYANAGNQDDGVAVARGPGYVVASLDMFASQGRIDNTLTWVYEQMLVSPESTSFAEVYDALKDEGGWKYLKSYTGPGFKADTQLTETESEALTTYLIYNKGGENTLFNYTVNQNRTISDTDKYQNIGTTRRLYTSVGWSYYLLYQDYDYGESIAAATGANYGRLVSEDKENGIVNPKEISNLFSRSTFVQMTDKKVSNLEISNTVVNSIKKPDDKEFIFTVKLYADNEKNMLDGSFDYVIYKVDENGIRTPANEGSFENGSVEITLTDGQVAVIRDLPYDAYYTVIQQPEENYITTVAKDGETPARGYKAEDKLIWELDPVAAVLNNTSAVAYVNAYTIDITIKKIDNAAPTKMLSGAQFVLYYTEEETDYYYQNGEFAELNGKKEMETAVTSGEDGLVTFENIPTGVYMLKEIKAPDGYNLLASPIIFTVKEGKIIAISDGYTYTETAVGTTITVSNSAGIMLPDTGGAGTGQFVTIGLLMLCSSGTLLYIKSYLAKKYRRKNGE